MVIAITYDNGNVGEHFGHAEAFKLFEIEEDGRIIDSAVVKPSPSQTGHDAMVAYLLDYSTEVLICGGIGEEARNSLNYNLVDVCAGVTGDVDEALQKLLRGELQISETSTCNCHEEGHSCCGGGAGSCGSAGGCCH